MRDVGRITLAVGVAALALPAAVIAWRSVAAQPARVSAGATLPGQAAFGAMSEVVRILENDSTTDWSKVDLEALRQHLIDMDLVVLRARVTQRNVPGGFEARVTGDGATSAAIARMVANQSRMLAMMGTYKSASQPIASGTLVTLTAQNAGDVRAVAQLRGLGFFGALAEGDHHAIHHMALARGDKDPHRHR